MRGLQFNENFSNDLDVRLMMMRFFISLIISLNALAASHHPQDFLSSLKNDRQAAEKIYKHFCANCHNPKPLLPLGAPQIGDELSWKKRLEPGFNTLFTNTLNGKGLMPARGGCFECSDEQLKMIVKYMIKQKK